MEAKGPPYIHEYDMHGPRHKRKENLRGGQGPVGEVMNQQEERKVSRVASVTSDEQKHKMNKNGDTCQCDGHR